MRYTERQPDVAYVTDNLLLPKSRIAAQAVKMTLEFLYGNEPVVDELTGEVLANMPRTIRMWDETDHHLIVPRYYISPRDYVKYPFPFVIEEYQFEEVDIESRTEPRDDRQVKAMTSMERLPYGTVSLSCGSGKTVIGLMMAARLRVPTIVIVNSKNLIAQWKEEIGIHLNVSSVGTIGAGQMDWEGHPIVVATVQTLASMRDKVDQRFRRRFGLALFDEGHHMSAPFFVKTADMFYGRRYALTATANRTDGLEVVYQYHLGPIIFKDLTQELIPSTTFHTLNWEIPADETHLIRDVTGQVNVSRLQQYLGSQVWRNELIVRDIRNDLEHGRQILVLSHSKEHVKQLAEAFGTENFITGDVTDEDERLRILRQKNPVFGTFQLARESLNKRQLDTLFITTPFGNSNDLQQSWGRIQRTFSGKLQPIVHVYEDTKIKNCVRACRELRKYLRVLHYPFVKQPALGGQNVRDLSSRGNGPRQDGGQSRTV